MSLLFSNNATGTLASPITSSDTSLTLNAGQVAAFPNPTTPDVFYATMTDAATQSSIEIVQVTAVSGNVMAIVRAQDGSTAQSWLAGDILSHRAIALEMRLWNAVVPPGGIIMWSGSIATIPEGWLICDGTLGTPNLQDRFVIGAGNTYAVNSTGGAASIALDITQLPAHNHPATAVSTVTDPGHDHPYNSPIGGSSPFGGAVASTDQGTLNTGTAVTGITVATSVVVGDIGSGDPVPTLPPYYALAFIMKT